MPTKLKKEKNSENKTEDKNQKLKKPFKLKINFSIIAILALIIYCIAITPKTFQNDTYYTIKIGELIKNNGIDMMDHFSWHQNLPYTYPHWLYDFCTYLVYSLGGFKGVYILTCALSAILGVSMYYVSSKISKSKVISFVVTFLSIYMLRDYITARAQLATFILFTWEFYFIERFIKSKQIRYAIGLICISILIANLHVAVWPFFFVLSLPYIAEWIVAVIFDRIIHKKDRIWAIKHKMKIAQKKNDIKRLKELQVKLDEQNEKNEKTKQKVSNKNYFYKLKITRNDNVKYLILIMIICAFTGLLTPLKDTPYTYLYKTMKGNTTKNINEHLPMTITDNKEALVTVSIFLVILIFTKAKIKLSDFLMLAGLCYLMLASRRQLSMFVVICSVIFCKLIVELINEYIKNKDSLKKLDNVFSDYRISICLLILAVAIGYNTYHPKRNDKYVDSGTYPVEACDYILDNIDLSTARFYNEYNYGSYMLFRGIPVFIDSRADLYSPEFSGNKDEDIFSDFIDTSSVSKFYEDTFEKYDINYVILKNRSKTNMIITRTNDKKLKQIYKDDHFTVYKRETDSDETDDSDIILNTDND